ncbi:DsrE family protein [Haloarcula sp. S1CR25-12]|uniref:DsrE family protein n=1 Tax=Haloarcula saliterrae TaxID=2950534 RepID=A0ABU2F7W2_9EURY|nr:DsrE family protein [Haloarcula sp. S1CR25-12]MDS0258358.1 DsrE family protein [Haloarcula sp. S1CR25-12]
MQSVVHLVSADETEQETALTIAQNMLDDESGSIDDVAVVVQGPAITAASAESEHSDEVQSLLDAGVSVRACRNTLAATDMDESALVDGIETVPEGAVEVTRLEDQGYAYLRP